MLRRRTCCTSAICSDQHVNEGLVGDAHKGRPQEIDKVPLLQGQRHVGIALVDRVGAAAQAAAHTFKLHDAAELQGQPQEQPGQPCSPSISK
jgi:hypothetical protein